MKENRFPRRKFAAQITAGSVVSSSVNIRLSLLSSSYATLSGKTKVNFRASSCAHTPSSDSGNLWNKSIFYSFFDALKHLYIRPCVLLSGLFRSNLSAVFPMTEQPAGAPRSAGLYARRVIG